MKKLTKEEIKEIIYALELLIDKLYEDVDDFRQGNPARLQRIEALRSIRDKFKKG